jgi:hypothetical protein
MRGAFMGKTVPEAKAILESMLHNHSKCHTERAPNPTKKVHSIEEENLISNKIDAILAYIAKQNNDSIPLQELVGNNNDMVDFFVFFVIDMTLRLETIYSFHFPFAQAS